MSKETHSGKTKQFIEKSSYIPQINLLLLELGDESLHAQLGE
jgi:hypothetical protein